MNLIVVFALLILLGLSFQPVQAGKECTCNARFDNNGVVGKNFGVIASCRFCLCRNSAMARCSLSCDEYVQQWAEKSCLQGHAGQQVRAHFVAGNCEAGYGQRTFTCKPPPTPAPPTHPPVCYKQITKLVTQTVPYPCGCTCGSGTHSTCGSCSVKKEVKPLSNPVKVSSDENPFLAVKPQKIVVSLPKE